MNISTTSVVAGMSASQDRMNKLISQISDGKRISKPSDDPIGAANALMLQEKQSIARSQQATADYALSILGLSESYIDSMQEGLMDVHSEGFYSVNASLTPGDITVMGHKVMAVYSSMLDLHNASTPSGPAFSGYSGSSPFSTGGTGPVYSGTSGRMAVPVGDSELIEIRGDQTSLTGNPSRDALQAVWDLGQQLLSGVGATPAQLDNVGRALDALGELRASFGGRMNQAEAASARAASKLENYAGLISRITDLDYAAALSELEKETAIQDMLGKVFQKTSTMSLANYI